MKNLRILLAALVTAMIVTVTAQAQMAHGTMRSGGVAVFKWETGWTQNGVGSYRHTFTITPLVRHVRVTEITCNATPIGQGFESLPDSLGNPGGAQMLEWVDNRNVDRWTWRVTWDNNKNPHNDMSSDDQGDDQDGGQGSGQDDGDTDHGDQD